MFYMCQVISFIDFGDKNLLKDLLHESKKNVGMEDEVTG